MAQFGRKKTVFEYLYSKPVIAILMVLVILLAMSVFERYRIERDMAARRVAAETEYQALQQRKSELEGRVEYLRGERGIEEEIRKHFDVAKEGETVVVLVGEDATTASSTPEPVPVARRAWYQFWR